MMYQHPSRAATHPKPGTQQSSHCLWRVLMGLPKNPCVWTFW
nr:MAG TPA: hypothetical protein [Caudoviricetes sp.]